MTTEVPLTAVLTSSPDTAGSLSASAVTASKGFAAHMAASPGGDLLNAVQYAALAYIPCALLMYGLAEAKAGADLSASSPMLTFEVLAMTAATVAGLYYIDRLVTYIPTYSGVPYAGISMLTVALVLVAHQSYTAARPHGRVAELTKRLVALVGVDGAASPLAGPAPQRQQQQQQLATGPPPAVATQSYGVATVTPSPAQQQQQSQPQQSQQQQQQAGQPQPQQATPDFASMYAIEPFQTGAGQAGGSFGSAI